MFHKSTLQKHPLIIYTSIYVDIHVSSTHQLIHVPCNINTYVSTSKNNYANSLKAIIHITPSLKIQMNRSSPPSIWISRCNSMYS